MANTAVSVTTLDKALLDSYPFGGKYFSEFYQGYPTLDELEGGDGAKLLGKKEGRQVRIPLRSAGNPNPSVGMAAGQTYPAASGQTWSEAVYNANQFGQTLMLRGEVFDKARGGGMSIGDMVEIETQSAQENARRQMNRLHYDDGSYLQATVSSTATSTTVTVDDTSKLSVGHEIVIRSLASPGTLASGQTANTPVPILTIPSSTTFTTGTSITATATTDGVFPFDCQGYGIDGFEIITHTSNSGNGGANWNGRLGGINRTTDTWWQSNRLVAGTDSGTRDFNIEEHVQKMLNRINKNSYGSVRPTHVFTAFQNNNNVANQVQAKVEYTGFQRTLKTGYEYFMYNNIKFVVDRDCPASKAYFIHAPSVYRYVHTPWRWDARTGSIWNRQTATRGTETRGTNDFSAYMYTFYQLVTTCCNCHGAWTNLSATE